MRLLRDQPARIKPDVAEAWQDPKEHFVLRRQYEGRRVPAGPRSILLMIEFDPDAYILMNPDVVQMDQDPMEHFLADGRYEERKLRPWA